MNSLISFIRRYREHLFVLGVLVLLFAYSLPTLTTKPRVSYDEGFFVEEAYNFATFGRLDIIVAPNTFSNLPHIASSSGFPGEIPLAIVFKLFGFGIVQARIYALAWMTLFLCVAYIFARKYFGVASAVFSTLLLVSFPPFHENGRMAMGDIPGFTFLMLGLLSIDVSSLRSGMWLGLSAIARPSVYVPAIVATFIERTNTLRKRAVKPIVLIGLAALPSFVLSVLLYLPNSVTSQFWADTIHFLRAPTFGLNSSPAQNLSNNLVSFFTTQTLFYFLILFSAIVSAYFIKGKREWNRRIVVFTAAYCVFVIIYFLRSPGWFKYLLPFQFFVFFFLPTSVNYIVERLHPVFKKYFIFLPESRGVIVKTVLAALVMVQLIQLFFFADIFKSSDVEDSMSYLRTNISATSTVAFIHGSLVPLSIPADRRYNFNVVNETLFLGKNPLGFATSSLPTYVVMPEGLESFSAQFEGAYADRLKYMYHAMKQIGRLTFYKINDLR